MQTIIDVLNLLKEIELIEKINNDIIEKLCHARLQRCLEFEVCSRSKLIEALNIVDKNNVCFLTDDCQVVLNRVRPLREINSLSNQSKHFADDKDSEN